MASITKHGMMECTAYTTASGTVPNDMTVTFVSQPRGVLYIKNQTRNTEARVPLHSVASGSIVWDYSVVDPNMAAGDLFTFEFSGKANDLNVRQSGSVLVVFSGSGSAEVSGFELLGE